MGLALAGCAAEAPEVEDDPYAQEFEDALSLELSDFEREVLADGQVTREEYDEAHERWLQCMEEAYPPETGIIVGLEEDQDGLYSTTTHIPANLRDSFDHDARDRIYDACARGTIDIVAGMYNSIAANPDDSSYEEMVFACLHDRGLVEDWYTLDHMKADLDKIVTAVLDQAPDGTLTTHPPPLVDEDYVTDLDMSDPAVWECR